MKRKEKSLRQLARELGVSASYLSQVKNGKRPTSERLLKSPAYATLLSKSVKQTKINRGVAQPGSAPEWGSGGRRFKSGHPDYFTVKIAVFRYLPLMNVTRFC